MPVPHQPKVFHITHLSNLTQLVASGMLYSDARRIRENLACQIVGMSTIKKRRLEGIPVGCHPDTKVGEYAPFYFCPRSIMLYILYRRNHPELDYRGGQHPIIHLQADLNQTVAWADRENVKWAFSDANASASTAQFYNNLNSLNQINWDAVQDRDFRDSFVREGKQAEFLIFDAFPWFLVERIGVIDSHIARQVEGVLSSADHQPTVMVERNWYF